MKMNKKSSLREEVEHVLDKGYKEVEEELEEEFEEEDADNESATLRLQAAVSLVKDRFQLGESWFVTKFNDRGEKGIDITLQNREFVVAVTINDPTAYPAFAV